MSISRNVWHSAKAIGTAFPSFFFLTSVLILLSGQCFADEKGTVITSDKLVYFSETKKYVATGSAKLVKGDTVMEADEMTYFEETAEVVATGNVRIRDKGTSIKAGKADLYIDEKTGTLYDAQIYDKKFKYYLSGHEIEKTGENDYHSPEGAFTTCDAPIPAWCFKGKDVDAVMGQNIKAKDSSLLLKDLPVFYTPYLWAPINTDRQTGFLVPVIGNSSSKGFEAGIPFYWLISENKDATFLVDEFSKRGLVTAMEYRFVEPDDEKGNWWISNINDIELGKDYLEVRGYYLSSFNPVKPASVDEFLSINYTNQQDYYQQYATTQPVQVQRYLDSTGEINLPLSNSRFYFLTQYWTDLQNPEGDVAQRLPEIGYVLNYTRVGNFMVSTAVSATDFWAPNAVSAGRIDLYPKIAYSVGTDVVLSQILGLRDTEYSFYHDPNGNDTKQRAGLEYDVTAHTRLYKDYESFTHIIEPSISYNFIYSSDNDLPVFDSSELFAKTSDVELSILNRFIVKGSEIMTLRLTQAVDTTNSTLPSKPFKVEMGIKTPFPLTMEVTYGVDTGKIETVTSDIAVPVFSPMQALVTLSSRYNRLENVDAYVLGAQIIPFKSLQLAGDLYYDPLNGGLTNVDFYARYLMQCWGVRLEVTKKPGDLSEKIMIELTGLTSKGPWKTFPGYPQNPLPPP
jgi:LPS-assembly protein